MGAAVGRCGPTQLPNTGSLTGFAMRFIPFFHVDQNAKHSNEQQDHKQHDPSNHSSSNWTSPSQPYIIYMERPKNVKDKGCQGFQCNSDVTVEDAN